MDKNRSGRPGPLAAAAAFALAVGLAACSGGGSAKAAAARTAAAAQAVFVAVRESLVAMVAELEAVYAAAPTLDLSIAGMDKAEGGVFDYFRTDKGLIYFKSTGEGCAYYASPADGVVTDAIKRRVRLMQRQEPALIKAYGKIADIGKIVFFGVHEPTSIGILYPYLDAVALFPPGLNFAAFDWYARGIANPGGPRWSAAPFTDLASGWVMDVAEAVRDGDRVVGTAVANLRMDRLASMLLAGREKDSLVLLGSDLTVIGLTAKAKAELGIAVLEDVDYVRQMRENSFVPERFRLDGSGQSPEIRELARRIRAGETEFVSPVAGRRRRCFAAPVPETGFFALALE
jgi:hypothetical protein